LLRRLCRAGESRWIRRQRLHVFVDLSSGVDLYADLRLIDNLPEEFAASLDTVNDVIDKMEILGARDLLVSLHRSPENNFTPEQTEEAFERTIRTLAAHAATRQVTLHLRMTLGKPPWNLPEAAHFLDRVGAPNLRLAASAALLPETPKRTDLAQLILPRIGVWLCAGRREDWSGKLWDVHTPLTWTQSTPQVLAWLKLSAKTPVLFDAIYPNLDAEYLDAAPLDRGALNR
jgi:hypothetical protein